MSHWSIPELVFIGNMHAIFITLSRNYNVGRKIGVSRVVGEISKSFTGLYDKLTFVAFWLERKILQLFKTSSKKKYRDLGE